MDSLPLEGLLVALLLQLTPAMDYHRQALACRIITAAVVLLSNRLVDMLLIPLFCYKLMYLKHL